MFTFSSLFSLSASIQVQVEPVGRWFEAFLKRRNRNVSASFQELEEEEELSEEEEDEELQLEEYPMLKTLDPKDWKVWPGLPVRSLTSLGKIHVLKKMSESSLKLSPSGETESTTASSCSNIGRC